MNLIDVVTITKNDYEGIKKTILSMGLLSKIKYCQVIVDSSDKEIAIKVKRLASNYGIKYFWKKPSGVYSAMNFGLSKCNSKWVWFLNGGDTVLKNVNVGVFENLLQISKSKAMVFLLTVGGKVKERPPFYTLYPPIHNWIPHPATIVRFDILKELGGFNEEYKIAADGDLWFKLMNYGANIDLIPMPLVDFALGGLSSNAGAVVREQQRVVRSNLKSIVLALFRKIWITALFLLK